MKELQSAIVTKFTSTTGSPATHNSLYNALSGRLYFGKAPQDISFPYAVFFIISDVAGDYMFEEQFDHVLIQFSLYSNSPSSLEIGNLFNYVKSLFDWCELTVSGFDFKKMERVTSMVDWIDTEECWQYVVQYRVLLES